MSPLRLLLEGPDLEVLLKQVRTDYGAEARIIQAEKVRRGGLGGFFARERFNIQVEVPHLQAQATARRAPEHSGGPVQSVMDLVDRLNLEDEALHRKAFDTPRATTASHSTAPPTPASAYARAIPPVAPVSSASPPQASVTGPSSACSAPVSTQSASFADVMSRLQQSIDSGAPAPAGASGAPDLPAEAAAPKLTVLPPVTSEPAPARHRARDRSPLFTGTEMVARATRMGVPSHVLAGIEDPTDVYRRLLAWVESRPMAPMVVSTHGQVIVVVGETTAAMGVAGTMARELRVDPSAIYLAVPASSSGHAVPVGRLLSDVSDIAIRRGRWQHSVGSTIVVVEAALPPDARGWLKAVVTALAPTFTWAVAQASTKVNDVVSWAAVIGHVDALALVNVPATGDPAAALAGPLPVGLLDEHRATVTRWMGMLTDR
jgi:hypothetical protein